MKESVLVFIFFMLCETNLLANFRHAEEMQAISKCYHGAK